VLHAAGLSPDTHWIALDGARPVGITFLKWLSEDAAENDYMGVASTNRTTRRAVEVRAVKRERGGYLRE